MGYTAQGLSIEDAGALYEKAKQFVSSTAGSTLEAARHIVEDPALPQIASSLIELNQLEQRGRPAPRPGAPTPARRKGIGLDKVVKPLRAFVYTRRHPEVGYAAVAGVLALPFILGYIVGTNRRGG